MKKTISFLIALFIVSFTYAQMDMGGGSGGSMRSRMNAGHFYGKVVDSASGASIPFAAVQITGPKWDSASQTMKNVVYSGQLTGFNGEFSLEKLPVSGPMFQPLQFTLQITAMGYKTYTTTISFDLSKLMQKAKKMQSSQNSSDPSSQISAVEGLINVVDKDLGNIKLVSTSQQLNTVTVNGEAPPMELKFDRKVFDVSKSITNTGGTAEDVLKNIPSINVDIDGNVTLRNSSPTIYVDGMPSTLTIDQIPAEEIDKVEVITNPSAKFDAAAGSGGIINIVLKHSKTAGYNGSIRAGGDSYGKVNGGLDFNMRQGKVNVFASVYYHQVKHLVYGNEDRDYTAGTLPLTDVLETDTNTMNGYFAFVRGGFDYFMDNRNTFTVSGTYGEGNFSTSDLLHTTTDTLHPGGPETSSSQYRVTNSARVFQNTGVQASYKHLFPKEGKELTANGSFYQGTSTSNSLFTTQYYDDNNNPIGPLITQQQTGSGVSNYGVAKLDYTNPLNAKSKIEAGVQATVNQLNSQSNNYILNTVDNEFISLNALNANYSYMQQIYAGYMTYSRDFSSRFSAQVGLRVETTLYNGQLADSTKYNYQYPASLFPSAYLTYHLTDKSDLQLNYSRHINRPGFMQMIPYFNYADSLNITQGNPNLAPEFVNSTELNYLHNFDKRNTFMAGAYYKYTTGLITSVSQEEYIPFLNRTDIVNTYENANSAYSYGLELTGQNSVSDWLDITSNINLFQSGINADNLSNVVQNNNLVSWFGKLNLTFKLPKNFSIQLNGNYLSKTIINPNSGGGGRWGGMGGGGGYGGGVTPSAQGYILPNYYVDFAIKKDFLKNKKATITFNIHDIFATSVSETTSTTAYYTQTTSRIRDQRMMRLTFSYKFGQTDFTLFKKKNMNFDAPPDTGGGDIQQ